MRSIINMAIFIALALSFLLTGYDVYVNTSDAFINEQGVSYQMIWQTFFSWFMPIAISLGFGAALGYLIFSFFKKKP
ncbi:hypothetical protein [Thalassotalea aquiviva]|uniref:hypothetical protein n=1 Tax=Thalassotalea aquiviva TaxID=3242415 RepID=UPI00352A88AC